MNPPIIKINENRLTEDEAYMQMAEIWAKRSKANRSQVGALIVKDRQIIADGWNGIAAGAEDDVCEYYENTAAWIKSEPEWVMRSKTEVCHAESNAITKLAKNGGNGGDGATMYVTMSPCAECAKLIKQTGIKRVVYRHNYRILDGIEMLRKLNVTVEQLKG